MAEKMAEKLFDKVKKSVIAGAHTSAQMLEEAARIGKLRLDILAERRKLSRIYLELGKEAHMALLEKNIATLSERPGVMGLSEGVEDCKRRIAELEIKASQVRQRTMAETAAI